MTRSPMLAEALDLAARGFRIAPGWAVIRDWDGVLRCHCSRDCTRAGKHTWLRTSWYLAASSNPAVIAPWFQHRLSSILCLMGGAIGAIALDIDGPDGEVSLAQLAAELGALPPTLTQITGRGRHLIFVVQQDRWVDMVRNRVAIAPGIDVRSERGYVRVGGLHVSGVEYRWADPTAPIATLPECWYLRLIERSARSISHIATPNRPDDRNLPSHEEREDRALRYIAHRPPAISGQRGHDALWAVTLDLVRGYVIDPERCIQIIDEHYSPRCTPGWGDDEIAHKVESALMSTEVGWAYHCGLIGDAGDRDDGQIRGGSAPGGDGGGAARGGDGAAGGDDDDGGDAKPVDTAWRASSALSTSRPATETPDLITLRPLAPAATDSVSYCSATIRDIEPGAVLMLYVTDGAHKGRTIQFPLDWPRNDRSTERWRRIEHAIGVRVTDPSAMKGARLRVEVIYRDGRLRVGRIYSPGDKA